MDGYTKCRECGTLTRVYPEEDAGDILCTVCFDETYHPENPMTERFGTSAERHRKKQRRIARSENAPTPS